MRRAGVSAGNRVVVRGAGVLSMIAGLAVGPAWAADDASTWARDVWAAAARGSERDFFSALHAMPADLEAPNAGYVAEALRAFEASITRREAERAAEIERVNAELDAHLAKPGDDKAVSAALRSAVELSLLVTDKPAFQADARIQALIDAAEAAARAAEARGDWFTAQELFFRLHVLTDESGRYRQDVMRQVQRFAMIRLYVPRRLWELRNQRRIDEGQSPLPPYNPAGDSFEKKLGPITESMVERAISTSWRRHVDRVPLSELLLGGLEAVRTFVTTPDLVAAFPALGDEQKVAAVIDAVERAAGEVRQAGARAGYPQLARTIAAVLDANRASLALPDTAVLHEFGNGAMNRLDEFSAIIWPDELAQFERQTMGHFVGVGVQIQLDDATSHIKIVTPLEGTPAHRAGIRAGEFITKVNGEPTLGFTLDQAVEVITGPANTPVTLTIARPDGDAGLVERDVTLNRARIEVASIKGWKRSGADPGDWDWFIDRAMGIGYVRVTGFTEHTTDEFDRAIAQMRREGLRALILDLRFNPGGYLNQAVSISNRFIDEGVIVATQTPEARDLSVEEAQRGQAVLAHLPVAILVNENSASASEIVSGAVQDYARLGRVRGVVVGQRTFGKGSVQNLWELPSGKAQIKLTTQYYRLPGGRLIHRRPGAVAWGVDPDLPVGMLPKQTESAINIRTSADVVHVDESGRPMPGVEAQHDPSELIAGGPDVQLEAALVLLQSQALAPEPDGRAMR